MLDADLREHGVRPLADQSQARELVASIAHQNVLDDDVPVEMGSGEIQEASVQVDPDCIRPHDDVDIEQNSPLRVARKRIGALPGREVLHLIGRQVVQPGCAIRSGDLKEAAIRPVHQGRPVSQSPVLRIQIAEAADERLVRRLGGACSAA